MASKSAVRFLSILVTLMLLVQTITYPIQGDVAPVLDAEESLLKISEEEQKVVDVLYKLEQEIQKAERDTRITLDQIEATNLSITTTIAKIEDEERSFALNKEVLGKLLKSYQKRGPGSTLEVILSSENLRDLLRRLNILRDLTRHTSELLDDISLNRQRLEEEQLILEAQVLNLEAEQKRLEVVLEEKRRAKEEQEAYLSSLMEERAHYENILSEITQGWEALKPVFSKASKGFTDLAESGALPPEALELKFTLTGAEASISAVNFNKAVADNDNIPEMYFKFKFGEVELSIPKSRLILNGNFEIAEENVLVFEAQSGSFYDVPLEQSAIDELFDQGKLTLDLKALTGGNQIKGVKSIEGKLVLSIKIKLF